MAIDDNTLYGLTGAQIKELPAKIDAVKGQARELTSADYNWPTANPTGVALWLLEPGFYTADATVGIFRSTSDTSPREYACAYLVGEPRNDVVRITDLPSEINTRSQYRAVTVTSGAPQSDSIFYLGDNDVRDNLTSTLSKYPLSANQGRVLNNKIGGDLSNLTTTDKSSLINAINEVAAAGGGGVTELTTADYNWNYSSQTTTNPDCVALWKLPSGVYIWHSDGSVVVKSCRRQNSGAEPDISHYGGAVVLGAPGSTYVHIIGSGWDNSGRFLTTAIADGEPYVTSPKNNGQVLTTGAISDNLTQFASGYVLSANQGRVLNNKITPTTGSGAPTTSTSGDVGKIYIDTGTDTAYMCVKADTVTPEYTWKQITA